MATAKRVKKKEHELLSDSNVEKVIGLLESTPPITKKDACELLNIAYNTTRLQSIIDGHKARKDHVKKMKASLRGKPLSSDEVKDIISYYMQGHSVAEIAKAIYRTTEKVNECLEKHSVPIRPTGEAKRQITVLPDVCVRDYFNVGEVVWSAKYHAACDILRELDDAKYEEKYGSKCYRVYVHKAAGDILDAQLETRQPGFNAYALATELGSMEHITALGVKL